VAREALDACIAGDHAPQRARATFYARGLALAEEALAADERDATAHFAAFCNRGRQMELTGTILQSLLNLHRLRRDIDRTLELAPDSPDALFGKGVLLLETPSVFGGDPVEGEQLLRRALDRDPHDASIRLRLARTLADRGAAADARLEAERAAADADEDDEPDVRRFLDQLPK
jgi:tetratricopeptide (TPR) repeat protein